MNHAPPHTASSHRRPLTVNGVSSTGWIDLDRTPSRGLIGVVCVPHRARCAPVKGQVLVIDGVMRVDGTERRMRGEFLVTKSRDCPHGRCLHVSLFPMMYEPDVLSTHAATR